MVAVDFAPKQLTHLLEVRVPFALAGLLGVVAVLVQAHQGRQPEVRDLHLAGVHRALWEDMAQS